MLPLKLWASEFKLINTKTGADCKCLFDLRFSHQWLWKVITGLWCVTPCSPVVILWCFGRMLYLYSQGRRESQRNNIDNMLSFSACCLHLAGYLLVLLINPEDVSSIWICNISELLSDYLVTHPRKTTW
jgi:hypothetical protein